MNELATMNPAEAAGKKTIEEIYRCLNSGQSFRLEAGAGAGKTHSLIKALQYLIEQNGKTLLQNNQQIACITFTNVATDEIKSRIDGHPAVLASTIHAFAWGLMKDYQTFLRKWVEKDPKWIERIEKFGLVEGIGSHHVTYELPGYPIIRDGKISLGHDDILNLLVALLDEPKFRLLLIAKYPVLFIDEYQDTDKGFADALRTHFLDENGGLLLGFFGDYWQKIYREGCGNLVHNSLKVIEKQANFRSVRPIVEVLNRIRPDLTQAEKDPSSTGYVGVYHTNAWVGERLTGPHTKGDLPPEEAHACLNALKIQLVEFGWVFNPKETKILMLTHSILAREQGYSKLASLFSRNESFVKKEDPYIAFLVDVLEPAIIAFEGKRYGELFSALGERKPKLNAAKDKTWWMEVMAKFQKLRANGTIGEVLEHVKRAKVPRLTAALEFKEKEYGKWLIKPDDQENVGMETIHKLKDIPYAEIIELARFISDQTPFSTKHGVKGAEFKNVLVVFGRGWNQYNFNDYLEWSGESHSIPKGKEEAYERNRNLFYVACSRPKERLALLFTQQLSEAALQTLSSWFGTGNIHSLEVSVGG